MQILTPTLLTLVAVSASAQTAKTSSGYSDLGRPGRFEIALTPAIGSIDISDQNYPGVGTQSGIGLDAQFHLPSVFFLKVGVKVYSDVNAYTFGLGVAIPAGNGRVTLGLDGTTLEDPEYAEYEAQAAFRVAYDHQFDFGLHLGAGVTQFVNGALIGDDSTAPTLTVGYKFGPKAPTLDLTYSPEDAILGTPDADGSLSLSLKIAF